MIEVKNFFGFAFGGNNDFGEKQSEFYGSFGYRIS